MDRRRFLQRVTATAVAVDRLSTAARAFQPAHDADLAVFVPSRGAPRVLSKHLEATYGGERHFEIVGQS